MKLAERIFRRTDYKITSPFGNRIHPITKKPSFHYGCDYGTKVQNWNQYALENGEVIEVRIGCTDKDGNGYGNYVKVKYPRINIQLLHAHLKQVNVKKGQAVNKDTVLGLTGTTGNSTGVHLHLGLQKIGSSTWIDPETYNYEEGEEMKFKIGDYVYALEDIKLYTSIEHTENLYTIKKGDKAYIRYIKGNEVALANPDTKEYFSSAWTGELDKLSYDEPSIDYKSLYEAEVVKNKELEEKISKAINDLK